ncbi:cupin domain-containing protein [Paraburkholderia sp. RL18-085-BIA-A]|uniref:cupin domain-containing protein n=1 Tax=Paraburkholderia sp. RL18-085-BIA-A TaxID=3031633 RepID=UPI0038B9B93C
MRLQPGARSFEHLHDSTELILILDGAFTDDDGTDFLPGHTVCYPAGSRHSTSSKEGCTVLVVAHTGSTIVSQPQGTHARVITGSKPMRNGSRKFFYRRADRRRDGTCEQPILCPAGCEDWRVSTADRRRSCQREGH